MTRTLQPLFDRYAEAWQARDPDVIVALHSPTSVFRLRLDGHDVVGRDALRSAFAEILATWPEFGLDARRVKFGENHWVLDWVLTAVVDDRPVRFDCLDLVTVGDDGLVERKDTFVDFLQMKAAVAR